MRLPKLKIFGGVVLLVLPLVWPGFVGAAETQPALKVQQLNISGDEFLRLTNFGQTDIEMSNYWLGYESEPEAAAPPEQQLPNGVLAPDESVLLSRESMATCGAKYSGGLEFSLSNSGGTLSLWRQENSGGQVNFRQIWQLVWDDSSKTDKLDINIDKEDAVEEYLEGTLPAPPIIWYFGVLKSLVNQAWHAGYQHGCTFTEVIVATDNIDDGNDYTWQHSSTAPPFTFSSVIYSGSNSGAPHIPPSDLGLKAVQISEIVPNPASPLTDAEDEFVEMYNPNDKTFDLSGFIIQIASASSGANHLYHIPAGTKIKSHGFLAFKSGDTSLSLSNGGGQVWLLDPLGGEMSTSQPYDEADDGMAWINAGGNWQWTARPTPDSANKVATMPDSSAGNTAKIGDKEVAQIAGDSANSNGGQAVAAPAAVDDTLSIHPLTLAIVAAAALLYGAYEYRHDLANRFRQFRRQRAARR